MVCAPFCKCLRGLRWLCSRFCGSTGRVSALLLCAMTLLMSGCGSSAGLTSVLTPNLPPTPTTPGAIVTDGWWHEQSGQAVLHSGQWVHLPAAEAGELLLWVEHAESVCR